MDKEQYTKGGNQMLCYSCYNLIKRGQGEPNECAVCGQYTHKSRPSGDCTKISADGDTVCSTCIRDGLVLRRMGTKKLEELIERVSETYDVLNKDSALGKYIITYSNGYEYWYEDGVYDTEEEVLWVLEEKGYIVVEGKYNICKEDVKAEIYKIVEGYYGYYG